MTNHFVYVCEFNKQHGQCRCSNSDKETIPVACDRPTAHNPYAPMGTPANNPLRKRLEKTVDSFLGSIVMPVVRESLVDTLEQDVKDWLIDNADKRGGN